MAVRGIASSGSGSTFVNSVTGTANEVTASPTTGAVIVGLAAIVKITTSLAIAGATIGTDALAVTGTASISSSLAVGNNVLIGGSFATSGASSSLQLRNGATLLSSPATASLQFGSADVDTNASIVAQTIRSQGALAGGTSDQAGKNFTFIISPGKGTGLGGSWILQTAPAGSTGTTVNAAVTRITADGPGNVVVGSAALATNVTDGFLYIPTCAGTPSGTPTAYTGRVPLIYDTTAHQFWIYDSGWKQPKTPAAAAIVTWQ